MTTSSNPSLMVTGATGKLGRLVIKALLKRIPAGQITAGVRNPDSEAARSLRDLGVKVRVADYSRPETLADAFDGIDKLLLISSSEVGQRVQQHRNVIDAATRAGVPLIAYTSILHADTSPLALAEEHRQTEAALRASGVPFVLLRNGWYTENYLGAIPAALAHGVLLGSAGDGRLALAARADYAEAAAAVLAASEDQGGRIYELAGDTAWTLSRLAQEIARQSGKPVAYKNLPEADYKAALVAAGLPEGYAALLADSDAGAGKGALFDESGQLGRLIGRQTTPIATTIAEALAS